MNRFLQDLIVIVVIILTLIHYVFFLDTVFAEASFILALITLTICIWMLNHKEYLYEAFGEAPASTQKETTANQPAPSLYSGFIKLLSIPQDSLNILKPQLNKVVKAVDPNNTTEEETPPGGDMITMDAAYVKANIKKEASDTEAEQIASQFNNINYIFSIAKELHPAAYYGMLQPA